MVHKLYTVDYEKKGYWGGVYFKQTRRRAMELKKYLTNLGAKVVVKEYR